MISIWDPYDDIEYCAEVYSREQVEPYAEKCKSVGCPSYIYCFFGRPRGDNSMPLPPICVQTIIKAIDGDTK